MLLTEDVERNLHAMNVERRSISVCRWTVLSRRVIIRVE